MKLFRPRAPKPLPDTGYAIQPHFSGNAVQREIAQRAALPALEPAIARVQQEIASVRSVIDAGRAARGERELRKLITEYQAAYKAATAAWEKKARQVQAGVAEMPEADAACKLRDDAHGRLSSLNRELAARLRADEAAATLDKIIQEITQ